MFVLTLLRGPVAVGCCEDDELLLLADEIAAAVDVLLVLDAVVFAAATI